MAPIRTHAVTARLGGGSLGTKMQQRAVGFKDQKGSMKARPQLQRRCRAALRIWGLKVGVSLVHFMSSETCSRL